MGRYFGELAQYTRSVSNKRYNGHVSGSYTINTFTNWLSMLLLLGGQNGRIGRKA